MRKAFLFLSFLLAFFVNVYSQSPYDTIRIQIHSNIGSTLFNHPYYRSNESVPNLIFEALEKGALKIYSDQGETELSKESMKNSLTDYSETYYSDGISPTIYGSSRMFMRLQEEADVNTRNNTFVFYPKFVTLYYYLVSGEEIVFGYVLFKDIEKLFNSDSRACWVNPYNNTDSIPFTQALKQHLYSPEGVSILQQDDGFFNREVYLSDTSNKWLPVLLNDHLNSATLPLRLQKRAEAKEQLVQYSVEYEISKKDPNEYNIPFYFSGKEVVRILHAAVKDGKLIPYTQNIRTATADNFLLPEIELLEAMTLSEYESTLITYTEYENFDASGEAGIITVGNYTDPGEMVLNIIEKVSVSNGTMKRTPLFIKLILYLNDDERRKQVALFKYADCSAILSDFKKGAWYNPFNNADSLTLMSALDKRLYKPVSVYAYYKLTDESIWIYEPDSVNVYGSVDNPLLNFHKKNLAAIVEDVHHPEVTPNGFKERDIKKPTFNYTTGRMLDLRKDANKVLFQKDKELSKIIVNAVSSGNLVAYNYSMDSISVQDFKKSLLVYELTETDELDSFFVPQYHLPTEMYKVSFEEQVKVDAKNKKTYLLKTISLFIPGEIHRNGRDFLVAKCFVTDLINILSPEGRKQFTEFYNKRKFASDLTLLKNIYGKEIYFLNEPVAYNLRKNDLLKFKEDFVNQVFDYEQAGKHGLITIDGKIIAAPVYDFPLTFEKGISIVIKNGKYGSVNKQGKEIIPAVYEYTVLVDSVVTAKKGYTTADFDLSGKMIKPWHVDTVMYPFSEGLAKVSAMVDGAVKYGFVNRKGEVVIPCEYEEASNFSEGLASVVKKGKTGFINKQGKVVIDFVYWKAGDFNGGRAVVKNDGKYGVIDNNGKVIVPTIHQFINDYAYGLASVTKDNLWGYFDRDGNLAVPIIYTSVSPQLYEGKGSVFDFGQRAEIDHTGKIISPFTYSSGLSLKFSDGLSLWPLYGRINYVDTTGKAVLKDLPHASAYEFSEGRARVKNNDDYTGYIDTKGKLVIPRMYYYAEDFSDGIATVGKNINGDVKYGCIDKNGKVIIPIQFDAINIFINGKSAGEKANKYYVLDKSGTQILVPNVIRIDAFSEGLAPAAVNIKDKYVYGYINTKGQWQIKPQFEKAELFYENTAQVTSQGRSYYIDATGKEVE